MINPRMKPKVINSAPCTAHYHNQHSIVKLLKLYLSTVVFTVMSFNFLPNSNFAKSKRDALCSMYSLSKR
ncbi:hypothetical protein HTH_1033 [Hydrogenobacter thermophilus TK-6]|uniref:Uncharacterized protein n=1 Tax=Hydrogenobacter thermophilus (strain DSM 6534 / IAM 12695 / TK-6) TaxID=608538 RepID=D3DI39_HYDTT|nr:hypothetical protein HTH_1033 [Hydrogenobacter thermophilus TK-6]